MSDEQFTVFSGRVEMTKDVYGIVHSIGEGTRALGEGLGLVKTTMDLTFLSPGFFCDEAYVELHFNKPVSLEWVRERVREVSKTAFGRERGLEPHVFLQTLRAVPAAENSMDRDYDQH